LENAVWCSKEQTLDQQRFFRASMTLSQSLMVTDGALELDYVR